MSFKKAMASAPEPVRQAFCAGLQGLRKEHAGMLTIQGVTRDGSVDLDAALAKTYPQAARWDYGVGYSRKKQERVVWIEVHDAADVTGVIKKLNWLKRFLSEEAQELCVLTAKSAKDMAGPGAYVWLSTPKGSIPSPNTRQAKLLANAGIRAPARHLELK